MSVADWRMVGLARLEEEGDEPGAVLVTASGVKRMHVRKEGRWDAGCQGDEWLM